MFYLEKNLTYIIGYGVVSKYYANYLEFLQCKLDYNEK